MKKNLYGNIITPVLHGFFKVKTLLFHKKKNMLHTYYCHQLEFYKRQVQVWEEETLNAKRRDRDVTNHLYELWDQIHENRGDNMLEQLEELIKKEETGFPDPVKSANVVINALVHQKCLIAEKHQIDFQVHVAVPYKLPFHDEDICIMLGNALDYAIDSAMEADPSERYISLEMAAGKDVLSAVIKHGYGRGNPGKQPGETHSLRLSLIRKAAERYHGEVLVEKDEKECSLTLFFMSQEISMEDPSKKSLSGKLGLNQMNLLREER